MLQSVKSNLSLADALEAEDFYAFSQVPNVELSLEEHGEYALSDLILELSHFIDDDYLRPADWTELSSFNSSSTSAKNLSLHLDLLSFSSSSQVTLPHSCF